MIPRRLLVVTYYYPPQPGSGSNRWAALVKYLRRAGHEVTVVTAAPPGHASEADSEERVVRTGSLNASPTVRRLLLRPERAKGEGDRAARPASSVQGVGGAQPAPGGVMPPLLWKVVVPDPWLVSWLPAAWRAVRRRIAEEAIDCLITSSPAESTHLLGLALGGRRPTWVADFRDGWCFEPLRPPFPTPPQRALDRKLEARVARSADAVVGVTSPIADYFGDRLGIPARLVSNGFDPELSAAADTLAETDGRRLTLVHTGALSGPRGRDPRPLLIALRRLLDAEPGLTGRLKLIVAGRSEEDERALVESAGVAATVQHLGHLPREQALTLQRNAGTLLLITSRDRCEATGKLYEYMAAGRPVVALAEGNEAARIVEETRIGVTVPPDDVDAIAGALRHALSGELERVYAPRGVERYAYPRLAEQMSELVEQAIQHRACRGASKSR